MASERKPVDSISIRQMGAIEVQSVQFGLIAAFVPQIESDNYLLIRLFTIFIQLAQVSLKVGLNGSL